MSNFRFSCVVTAIAIASAAGAASAGSITLHEETRGWVNDLGIHTADNANVLVGLTSEKHLYRSYFQFDISGISGVVTGGSFSVIAGTGCNYEASGCLFTPDGSETVAFYDVNEADLESADAGTDMATSVFEDLGTGASYGEATVVGANLAPMPAVAFSFSDALISDLNKAIQDGDKTFALGARLLTLHSPLDKPETFWSHSASDPGLKLTSLNVEYTEQVAAVPLPASLPLLAGAFAALGFAARRSKKS